MQYYEFKMIPPWGDDWYNIKCEQKWESPYVLYTRVYSMEGYNPGSSLNFEDFYITYIEMRSRDKFEYRKMGKNYYKNPDPSDKSFIEHIFKNIKITFNVGDSKNMEDYQKFMILGSEHSQDLLK